MTWYKKSCLFMILLLFFFTNMVCIFAYEWPVIPFDGPHPIWGTLGEYRTNPPHFHDGVDIGHPDENPVFSVTYGKAVHVGSGDNTGVRVANFKYIHLQDRIPNNYYPVIPCTTRLGNILVGQGHVHFSENNGSTNPLRFPGGLDDYVDTESTEVWDIPDFMFYRDNSYNSIKSPLWGWIDILVRARDSQSNGSETVGIYRIGYQIINKVKGPLLDYTENIRFDNIIGEIGYVYDISRSNRSTYYYYVTNSLGPTGFHFWNTKLLKNAGWNHFDARINSEAEFPDGEYRVWVMAYDVAGNGGDTLNRRGAMDEDVIIDNFIPYVEMVEIRQDEQWQLLQYRAYWDEPLDEYSLGDLIDDEAPGVCYSGVVSFFSIYFSEIMDTSIVPIITILLPNGEENAITNGNWLNNTTFAATANADFFDDAGSGNARLCIGYAQDKAGNYNDGFPKTIAQRIDEEKWSLFEEWPDDNYVFLIKGPPQLASADPPWVEDDGEEKDGGGEGDTVDVDIYKEIKLVFNMPMDTTSVRKSIEIKNVDNGSYANIEEMEWTGENTTVTVRAYDPTVANDTTGFAFHTTYEMTIFGTAEDTSGMTLDGDEDGKSEGSPEDDVLIRFTTRDPNFDIEVKPWISKIKVLESKALEVKTTNLEETRGIRVSYRNEFPLDPNWGVSAVLPESVYIPAQEISLESHFIGKMGSG